MRYGPRLQMACYSDDNNDDEPRDRRVITLGQGDDFGAGYFDEWGIPNFDYGYGSGGSGMNFDTSIPSGSLWTGAPNLQFDSGSGGGIWSGLSNLFGSLFGGGYHPSYPPPSDQYQPPAQSAPVGSDSTGAPIGAETTGTGTDWKTFAIGGAVIGGALLLLGKR